MRQVDRMSGLIGNLVQIARAEERADKSRMTSLPLSRCVAETADTFEPVATSDSKKLVREIADDVTIIADEGAMRQLVSLLIDNAIKYCDAGGTVTVHLDRKGKSARLTVSNDYKDGAGVDYNRFFERFYREDASHNTEKGGYGIGLSIAESIVRQYDGSIGVSWANGVISFTCLLP
jgi:signal transduction histidine kinase